VAGVTGRASNKAAGGAPTLVFIVNHVAFFVSHRLPIALEAKRRGWRVQLLTGRAGSDSMEAIAVQTLATSGVPYQRVAFIGSNLNPLMAIAGVLALWWQLLRSSPDIVHCASPVGLLYGGIAARLARVPSLVLAISGMGYLFTPAGNQGARRRLVRALYERLLRFVCGHGNLRVIVQNGDDQHWVIGQGFALPEDVRLIPGSGVDLGTFRSSPVEGRDNLVVFPARMLRDKGLVEFVDAARRVRMVAPDWRFVLAGTADYRNPSGVPRERIEKWVTEGVVAWSGHIPDIAPLFSRASIVCLPSYREGMPKALLEAAAAGCAVVTTDSVGCREAIIPGKTGDLVPIRDVDALTRVLLELIRDRPRREAYGRSGRLLAAEKFGMETVLQQVFATYASLEARR
jgi:glycosyltransferase involved in cell wall biosynthesis